MTAFTFSVTRGGGDIDIAAEVEYGVTGSGTSPADIGDFSGGVMPAGLLSFAAGEGSKKITVQVAADTTAEFDETFDVVLSNASAGSTITVAVGTILSDDFPPPPVFLSDDFSDGNLDRWTSVDQGSSPGASNWSVINQVVVDTSDYAGNGTGFVDNRLGTYLQYDSPAARLWQDYTYEVSFRSTDDDGMGVLFYYTDENNYYKVEFSSQFGFSKLFLVQHGVETTLATVSDLGFTPGADTQLEITVDSGNITVTRDGADVFGTIQDSSLASGSVAVYSWLNSGSLFDDVTVTSTGTSQEPTALFIEPLDAVKAEGDAGTTAYTFTITRDGDLSGTTEVDYQLAGSGLNPATAGDFSGATCQRGP